MSQRRTRLVTILLLLLALVSALAAGALLRRQAYLTRGFPKELPAPIADGGARLGINVDLSSLPRESWPEHLARMRAAGISHLKQPFYFNPTFDWQQAEAIVSAVTAADLVLVPLLDGDPVTTFAPPDLSAYAAWAGSFAARFGSRARRKPLLDAGSLIQRWTSASPSA